jgi:hypothetical protein
VDVAGVGTRKELPREESTTRRKGPWERSEKNISATDLGEVLGLVRSRRKADGSGRNA